MKSGFLSPVTWIFITWLLLLSFIPFLLLLSMSFFHKTPMGLDFTGTLENYYRCFQWLFVKVLFKTFSISFFATISTLALGFPVAYYLSRASGPMKRIGLLLIFIPFWTNFILRIHALIALLGNHGLLNQIFIHFGGTPMQWLYTRTGVYIGLVYNYLPFLVVPIYASLEKLDPTLREAAFDLGANRIQTFLKVTLPNIKGGVFVGSLFVFIPMLGEYIIPDLLGGAKEVFLGNVMVSQFFVMQDWPFGSAIAGILATFLLLGLLLQNGTLKLKRFISTP